MNNKILFSIIAVSFVGGMFTVAYAGPMLPMITLAADVTITGDMTCPGYVDSGDLGKKQDTYEDIIKRLLENPQ